MRVQSSSVTDVDLQIANDMDVEAITTSSTKAKKAESRIINFERS